MTIEERAKEIAAAANPDYRSDGFEEGIELLALQHLTDAVADKDAEITRLRGERDKAVPNADDQVEGFLRFYASEPYCDASNQTTRVRAVLLITAADLIAKLQAALAAVLERDGGKACRCIHHSRDAEREYEIGGCPHQKAVALL